MRVYFIVLFLCVASVCTAQKKELEQGLLTTNEQGYHTAYFKNYRSTEKINKWLNENGYQIIDSRTKPLNKKGKLQTGIYYIEYASAQQIAYDSRPRNKRTETETLSAGDVLLGLAALAGVVLVADAVVGDDGASQPDQSCGHKLSAEPRYLNAVGYLDIPSKVPELKGWGSKEVLTRYYLQVIKITSDRQLKVKLIKYEKLTKDSRMDSVYNFDRYHEVLSKEVGDIHYSAENLICFYSYGE